MWEDGEFSVHIEDLSSESMFNEEAAVSLAPERDELHEVEKFASKDTSRISRWRTTLTSLLIVTALTVIVLSYKLLRSEENKNFKTAFTHFSRTVADAAISQQRSVRGAFVAMANAVSASAQSSGATWPFYDMPLFEVYAKNHRARHGGVEFLNVVNIVKHNERGKYAAWANEHYEQMVQESHIIKTGKPADLDPARYTPETFHFSPDGPVSARDSDQYLAAWSYSPPPTSYGLVNWDLAMVPAYDAAGRALQSLKNETITTSIRPYAAAIGTAMTKEEHDAMHSKLRDSSSEHPHSIFFHPVQIDATDESSSVVAIIGGGVAWDGAYHFLIYSFLTLVRVFTTAALQDLIPDGVEGIYAIIRNNCNQSFTYSLEGHQAIFLGAGDLHETAYNDFRESVDLSLHSHPNFTQTLGHCMFSMVSSIKFFIHSSYRTGLSHHYWAGCLHPSRRFERAYITQTPAKFAASVALTFTLVILVYFVYDILVQKRNKKLLVNAAKSNAIVSSIFPSAFRDKMLEQQQVGNQKGDSPESNKQQVLSDLYLETSVLFADIVGFTAWSSIREPSQVFTLLEAVFGAFDDAAKRHGIFKIETVGDCYVAAAGLPDPRKDHAVAIARFARDLLTCMYRRSHELELTLGPETCELGLRIGIHSGPVTAGVLKGDRARFQLFGDSGVYKREE